VDEESLALEVIGEVGFSGQYLDHEHTARHFRGEHFIPRLLPREPYDTWREAGAPSAVEHARERVRHILAAHEPQEVDPLIEHELNEYRHRVAERPMEEFYAYEDEALQDLSLL
jgi:trimethylamine--corrinoid protein Co-methyltransferase